MQGIFVEEYDPTLKGAPSSWYDWWLDVYRKQCVIDDEVALLDVLDTAGQEEYSAMLEQYIRTGDGFLLVYSITSRASFEEIATYQRLILTVKHRDTLPMIVVGNNAERGLEREVSVQGAEQARIGHR